MSHPSLVALAHSLESSRGVQDNRTTAEAHWMSLVASYPDFRDVVAPAVPVAALLHSSASVRGLVPAGDLVGFDKAVAAAQKALAPKPHPAMVKLGSLLT